jgi:hypothetical protein
MCVAHLQTCFNWVERVVRKRVGNAVLPPDICAVGDSSAIVLRTRRSTKFSNFFVSFAAFLVYKTAPEEFYLSG